MELLETWCHMITGSQAEHYVCSGVLTTGTASHIATHLLVVVLLVVATSSKKPRAPAFQVGSQGNLTGLFFNN